MVPQNTRHALIHPVALVLVLLTVIGATAGAQTFRVIHKFTPQASVPLDGLTADSAGNLYGTTSSGGSFSGQCFTFGNGCGTVFRLALHNSSWIYTSIYNFQWGDDGAIPYAAPVFGPDGSLYGTTYYGGGSANCTSDYGCGTVYELLPPASDCQGVLCYWSEKVLYAFAVETIWDGENPEARVNFDSAGNLYGTTYNGGNNMPFGPNYGTVYELTPSQGSWNETILRTFLGGYLFGDISEPFSGVILDRSGNVYGTGDGSECGLRQGCGAVYELRPGQGTWTYQFIHQFNWPGDGLSPAGAPIWDAAGNMYGSTDGNGLSGNNGPSVWKLSPTPNGWTETILHAWSLGAEGGRGSLTMDADGNVYGVQSDFWQGPGSVFKLTNNNGVWVYTTLHQFSGEDGEYPNGSLVVDGNGNIFGTTTYGGLVTPECYYGCGVVFEISQQ